MEARVVAAVEQALAAGGQRGGRKINHPQLLVDALDLARVPRPLDSLLVHL